jgi:hypothetical protein
MTFTRGLGNRLIRAAFHLVIGPGNTDLLSGYRAFNRRFRAAVELRSEGFEIETELASEAVAKGLGVIEVSIPYHARIAGTQSKLRAFRDGGRILATIVRQGLRLRPARLVLLWVVPCLMAAAILHRAFAIAAGLGVLILWGVLLADLRSRRGTPPRQGRAAPGTAGHDPREGVRP